MFERLKAWFKAWNAKRKLLNAERRKLKEEQDRVYKQALQEEKLEAVKVKARLDAQRSVKPLGERFAGMGAKLKYMSGVDGMNPRLLDDAFPKSTPVVLDFGYGSPFREEDKRKRRNPLELIK